jgi:radical SAM protein with 4Fe4S-binding SPASM domain
MLKQPINNKRLRKLLAKVMTSPRHFVNLCFVLLAYVFRLQKVAGQPVVLDVEPVNTCNFQCPHCPVTYADSAIKHLALEEFETILNQFPYALRVKLQGMGEPFLNKSLLDLIGLTASRHAWCEVLTNGSALDLEKLRSIEQLENFQLTVSIDAAEKAAFEKIRPGSDFNKIINNVDALGQHSKLNIAAWMVVSEGNKGQVEDVIKLLAGINVHTLGLQMVIVDYGKKVLRPKTVGKRVRHQSSGAYYKPIKECAKQNGVRLSISDKLYSKRHPCPWPWMGAFVDVSGNIVPCCAIGDASICNMGNLYEVGFDAIWNSPDYKELRRRHKEKNIPEFCESCYR